MTSRHDHSSLYSVCGGVLQIPSHIYHMVFEVMKNAMQATVDKFLETTDVLPPIKETQSFKIIIINQNPTGTTWEKMLFSVADPDSLYSKPDPGLF